MNKKNVILMDRIEYADFAKREMRTGKVLAAELLAGSRKLLKVTVDIGEAAPTAAPNPVATSSDFGLGQTPEIAPPSQLIPVSNAGLLFIQRTSVLYFKFLPPNDPAIPYLK